MKQECARTITVEMYYYSIHVVCCVHTHRHTIKSDMCTQTRTFGQKTPAKTPAKRVHCKMCTRSVLLESARDCGSHITCGLRASPPGCLLVETAAAACEHAIWYIHCVWCVCTIYPRHWLRYNLGHARANFEMAHKHTSQNFRTQSAIHTLNHVRGHKIV